MHLQQLPPTAEMYGALVRRDSSYEGVFVVGVKTTGIFCRPDCPARKPKPQNVEYFASGREAMMAGYRACLRCMPLQSAGAEPDWLRGLLVEVNAEPDLRIRDAELRDRGLDPARVRRWFQRHHGMTFQAWQRGRRLSLALARINQGDDLTQTGFGAGYESASGFREAFHKLFGNPPGAARNGAKALVVTRVLTPLGAMLAIATDDALCLLEFADRRMLQTQLNRLRRQRRGAPFAPGDNDVLARTQREVREWFAGERQTFSVPLGAQGTEFQQQVWAGLRDIPYGATRSYAEQASAIGRPTAVRAVGRANGDNPIAIMVPCHRVLGADGSLTGYGGQLWRKRFLLDHERATLAGEPPAPPKA